MDCDECRRLVAAHLDAIAHWKEAARADFTPEQNPHAVRAWESALAAEQALHEHREHDGCTSDRKVRAGAL